MKRPTRKTPFIPLVPVVLAAAIVSAARADDIRLRTSARLPAGAQAVHLGDIADLDGPAAERFKGLLVAPVRELDRPTEVSIGEVRTALDAAGVHWGLVNLSGNTVVVRPPARTDAAAPRPNEGVSLVEHDDANAQGRRPRGTDDLTASTLLDEPTLRGTIAHRFVNDLGLHPDRIRLGFDADDRERLDLDNEGVTWELRLEGNPRSDRVTITVRAWRDGRITESAHVTVRPQLLTPTAVLARDVARDEPLTRTDITTQEAWLPPSQAALVAAPGDVEGRFAEKTLRSGTTLRQQNLRSPTLVDRGDRVVIRCLIGGIVLSLQAEARADGAAGDTIEFRKLGERTTFLATVTQRGEAVLDVGG